MFGTAAALAVASLYAADAAREAARVSAIQDSGMSLPQLIDVNARRSHTLHPGDCSACGSQEFRRWQGVSVCSYCRSVDAPQTAPRLTTQSANHLADRYELWTRMNHAYITQRREAHARLTTD